jgi:hypothetical protein
MLERGFQRVFGKKTARKAARVALACDQFPFSGYPRWEINSSWNVVSRTESPVEYQKEEKHFARLAKRARGTPGPLRASVELRHYFAARDLFVRRGGPKPSVQRATRAAREMWERTRDPQAHGPNEEILRADAMRLQHPRPRGWQLCYRVKNFAPVAQLVAVEQQRDDGTWATLQACHTIEFQARAARPRGHFMRAHAAPLDWDGDLEKIPRLRFALRGMGAVRLSEVLLSDGHTSWKARLARSTLGFPAPRRGFPQLDWAQNRDTIAVHFRTTPLGKKKRTTDRPRRA